MLNIPIFHLFRDVYGTSGTALQFPALIFQLFVEKQVRLALLATIGTREEKGECRKKKKRERNILTSRVCAVSSGFIAEHRVKVDVKARRAGWLRDGRRWKPWKEQMRWWPVWMLKPEGKPAIKSWATIVCIACHVQLSWIDQFTFILLSSWETQVGLGAF